MKELSETDEQNIKNVLATFENEIRTYLFSNFNILPTSAVVKKKLLNENSTCCSYFHDGIRILKNENRQKRLNVLKKTISLNVKSYFEDYKKIGGKEILLNSIFSHYYYDNSNYITLVVGVLVYLDEMSAKENLDIKKYRG